jgi:nitronate monooxygenase
MHSERTQLMNDTMNPRPLIIQGGMGAGISDWRLARAVSRQGQLGVVSGTALDAILVRRLQMGDPGGHMRHALDQFPSRPIADRIWRTYFVPAGKSATRPFAPMPLHEVDDPPEAVELCIAANFVEVLLAREGHTHPVGINYLEKIQIPHLASLYGAMLAGVDYVLMGAGIPFRVPGVLDRLARHETATYPLSLAGHAEDAGAVVSFDPRTHLRQPIPPLKRPAFLAIVASHVLAAALLKRANGTIDGFVVEGPTAGGHNAPPRGKLQLNALGEPIYGERDTPDLGRIRDLGLPFWLAGGYGDPTRLNEARALGAAGVQVGTAFAFCEESGLRPDYKEALLAQVRAGTVRVMTDPLASPTSFPFKVAPLAGTVSEAAVYEGRARVCDLGYLREAYRTESGTVGFRCAAEPVAAFLAKGGALADTVGRRCVCNALVANIGLGQTRGRSVEPGLVTAGDDLAGLGRFMPETGTHYSAADVIARILQAA